MKIINAPYTPAKHKKINQEKDERAMSKKLKHRKVYVQSFPGAITKCMEDYKKYLMRDKQDHFILQFGTNDLTGS